MLVYVKPVLILARFRDVQSLSKRPFAVKVLYPALKMRHSIYFHKIQLLFSISQKRTIRDLCC